MEDFASSNVKIETRNEIEEFVQYHLKVAIYFEKIQNKRSFKKILFCFYAEEKSPSDSDVWRDHSALRG